MNVKLGGELWGVQIPLGNAMFVGIDLWKDSQTQQRVAAFVSTLNSPGHKYKATRFFSRVSFENRGTDFISSLEIFMRDALYKFRAFNNGEFPNKIIVYRDGVSDGQFDAIKASELPQLTRALESVYGPNL
jgi:aubergine-like protein